MANRRLIVEIVGDSRSLERSFARSTKSAQRFSLGLGTIVKGAVGFLAIQKSADLAGDAIRAGINEFSESAKVQAQTQAVIKSTGAVANVTAKQIGNLATSLQRMSGIDDELIQRGENLILTFKNVRNEVGKGNAIFDRATKAAVDLSVAGFGSIETTSKQLGKALNDPVRGMTALARAGVTFTQAQKDQIKSLVESNRVLDAQKLILREVESQVGGSARALGETLPGKLNILRQTFNNLAGDLIGQFEPAIKRGADAVVDWLSQTKNQERIQRDIAAATKTVVGIVGAFVDVLKSLRDILSPVVDLLGGVKNAVKLLLGVMVASKVYAFATALSATGTAATATSVKVTALRASLLRLVAIGAILIPIEVFLNREAITKAFNDLTDKLPFGHGKEIEIGVGSSPEELAKLREQFVKLEGEGSDAVKQLDAAIRAIARLKSKRVEVQIDTVVNKIRPRTATGPAGARGGAPDVGEEFASAITGAVAKAQEIVRNAIESGKKGVATTKRTTSETDKVAKDAKTATEKQLTSFGNLIDAFRVKRQALQFRALGFDALGGDLVPGIANLKTQLASLTKRLAESGVNISSKLKGQLAGVRKVLSGEFGKATVESRAKIKELFDTIRGEFDKEASGPLTKATALKVNKLLKNITGLSRDQERQIRANLSSFNSAGLALVRPSRVSGAFVGGVSERPINMNLTVVSELDGQTVARNTTKHQTKTGRGTRQKRGPNRRIGP